MACSTRNTNGSPNSMDPQVRPRGGKHWCCKDQICELAKAEHRLFRMRAMVDEANALSEDHEFSADAEIDHNVLHECMRMFLWSRPKKECLDSSFPWQCWSDGIFMTTGQKISALHKIVRKWVGKHVGQQVCEQIEAFVWLRICNFSPISTCTQRSIHRTVYRDGWCWRACPRTY